MFVLNLLVGMSCEIFKYWYLLQLQILILTIWKLLCDYNKYHWNSLLWSKVKKQSILDLFSVVEESVSSKLMHDKIDSSILWVTVELVLKPRSFRKLFARLFFWVQATYCSFKFSFCMLILPFLSCTYHAISLFCILA